MKKLLVTIMSVMLIFSISQAYVVTIHGPNCTFKMSSPSDSEIILSDLKNGIRWWKVTDNSNNIIGVINNEFMMPEDNVKVTPMYEGNQIVAIQTEGGDVKYNGNKVNTVETIDGGNYEFTIEADTGYKIKSLIIDGTSTTVNSSYTFTNVNENHTIKATFEKIIPILSANWYGTPTVGETTIEKSSITSIALVDSYTPVGEVATSWNASSGQADGILTAYLEDDGSENGTYKITIAGTGAGKISVVRDSSEMFNKFTNATMIDGLNILDVSNATNLRSMFRENNKVVKLDVGNWNISNVSVMEGIFNGCNSLEELDVSKWDTSSLNDLTNVFGGCNSLKVLDVSKWDVSNVNGLTNTFSDCSSLEELDVSNWNVSKLTGMMCTFNDCGKLTNLDLSKWKPKKLGDMAWTFRNCSSLTNLAFGEQFDTSNVGRMWVTFYNCKSLTNLDLSNFNTSSATTMSLMFDQMTNLEQITLGENFSFYGANKGVEGASVLTTLPNKTWYDEAGNSYTATEIAELSNPAGTYYATNPVQ